ncbi:MAG: hypothetical protein ACTHLA_00295 [Asticcacaulis sp.]|uniref:hypothetical protein n=1 Tax=Asticcacaulis sp. TaxID=1872648 RepID=UPI003F7BC234
MALRQQNGLTRRAIAQTLMAARALPIRDPVGAPRLTPFGDGQVGLGAGPFLDAQKANRAFMMRQEPDRLLHSFRLNAGLPSAAQPLASGQRYGEHPLCASIRVVGPLRHLSRYRQGVKPQRQSGMMMVLAAPS